MKRIVLLLVAACCSAAHCFGETKVGLAYGIDDSLLTDHQTFANANLWVAGTAAGPLFGHFSYTDDTGGAPTWQFIAQSARSFTGYIDPLFGRVADVWLDGFTNNTFGNPFGSPTVAHVRISDPSSGIGQMRGLFLIELFDPHNLTAPFRTVLAITEDQVTILLKDDAGAQTGAKISQNGFAYSTYFQGGTDRGEKSIGNFRVYSNGIVDFHINDGPAGFRGTRLKSFNCTNTAFVGKVAEFWLDGYCGPTEDNAHTPKTAHIVVTDPGNFVGISFVYLALYDPGHLDHPTFERLAFVRAGFIHVMCK